MLRRGQHVTAWPACYGVAGSQAVIVGEMASFSQCYGFEFRCHEIRHPNRKAGEERGFWTVETNFLPGRRFENLEDMNRQAFEWATVRMYHRPLSKTGLIPAKAFEHERRFLKELPTQLPAPYVSHERGTDQYGYVSFEGNYYWVPGTKRDDVKLLQYADRLKIFVWRACVAEYRLPANGVKNARFSPEGQPPPPHSPKNRKRGSQQEEKRLRSMGPEVAAYVDYVIKTEGIKHHHFLRKLFALSRLVTQPVFVRTLQRALRYRVAQIDTLERIAWFCTSQGEAFLPDVQVDESFRDRPAYQEGRLTDEPDLSIYDDITPDGITPDEDNAAEERNEDQEESEDNDG